MTVGIHIASVNQDPGIRPDRRKGAAVHLQAMRKAFRKLDAVVCEVDNIPDPQASLAAIDGHRSLDLVYERYALGRPAAARFARDFGIPYVLEVNAPLAEEQARWRGLPEDESDAKFDRETFAAAGLVAAVSEQVAEYAIRRGADPEKVRVCPNGIDTALFHPQAACLEAPGLDLPGGAFVLGFHGRERPWHGFPLLVKAATELRGLGVPAHLLVVGKGEFRALDHLPTEAWTRVPWVEHEQIPTYVARFHVAPLTYAPDAPCYFSPLKLAEAMACGAVPVVPDLGDLPKIVLHGDTGLVYPPGDKTALVEALRLLHSDPRRREALSSAAAAAAARQGWDLIARQILDHFGLGTEKHE